MTIKTLDISEAVEPLATYVRDLHKQTTVITECGKPVAVVLPIENADDESISLSQNPKFLAIIERSRVSHRVSGGLTSEEVRRQLGLPEPVMP